MSKSAMIAVWQRTIHISKSFKNSFQTAPSWKRAEELGLGRLIALLAIGDE
jgi:hypothetical protein